jgi:hypothetical protein
MSHYINLSADINALVMQALGSGMSLAMVITVLDRQAEVLRLAAPIAYALNNAEKRSTACVA